MTRPTHDFSRPVWTLLYLHNWDPDGGIYPEIHGVYDSEVDALADQRAMRDPTQYQLRKAYFMTVRER